MYKFLYKIEINTLHLSHHFNRITNVFFRDTNIKPYTFVFKECSFYKMLAFCGDAGYIEW